MDVVKIIKELEDERERIDMALGAMYALHTGKAKRGRPSKRDLEIRAQLAANKDEQRVNGVTH